MSEFVKGQRVRSCVEPHKGNPGEVVGVTGPGSLVGAGMVQVVMHDQYERILYFRADELEIIADGREHEQFRRGQRVRIVNPQGGEATDQGEVRSVSGHTVFVTIDGEMFGYRGYTAEQLEILHDGRAEATGVYEPQEDTFRVDQRVTINANPQAPASIRKLDGMSGKVCTMVPHIEVVLDGTFGRHVVDSSDLIPEVVVPSKRDEYAAKAERMIEEANRKLNDGHGRSATHYDNAAMVFATLAVAYGREQGR